MARRLQENIGLMLRGQLEITINTFNGAACVRHEQIRIISIETCTFVSYRNKSSMNL